MKIIKSQKSNYFTEMWSIVGLAVLLVGFLPISAIARDITYYNSEVSIYVKKGEVTQVNFPGKIIGGYRNQMSKVNVDRKGDFLVLLLKEEIDMNGEVMLIHLEDGRTYALRIKKAGLENPRDDLVRIIDTRAPEFDEEEETQELTEKNSPYAPPSIVSGLMREMILHAEFGKGKGIPGYKRSNRYSGETVLRDGAIEAVIDEIFMGANIWGYVISVTNLLEVQQRLNPATFRLDGTMAVVIENWDLAPLPKTVEQKMAGKHKSKVYIITKSKRR